MKKIYVSLFKIKIVISIFTLIIAYGSQNQASASSPDFNNLEVTDHSKLEFNEVNHEDNHKILGVDFLDVEDTSITKSNSLSVNREAPFYELAQRDDVLPSDSEDDDLFREIEPEDLLPEEEPEPPDPEEAEEQQELILESLSNTNKRYPFILNPFDNLTISEDQFSPDQVETYSDFDIRFAEDNPALKQLGVGHFRKEDQFYWQMSGNRIVFETQGVQSGVQYQGQTNEVEINEAFLLRQAFFGVQAIWTFSGDLSLVEGEQEDLDEFTVFSIIAEAGGPEELFAGENIDINIDIADIDFESDEETRSLIGTGTGTSDRIQGGGSLFGEIDPANAPRILQAFPTVDLRPLLDGGNVPLEAGAEIPDSALEDAGLTFGSPLTEEVPGFSTAFSSDPGLKIGQRETFDNLDLLNVLVNPFLSDEERDERYLNSLLWAWLGQQEPEVFTQERREDFDWHRFYFSTSYNRGMLEYGEDEVNATYTNVYLNPGGGITLSFDEGEVDSTQSINSTLGMLLGFPLAGFGNLNNLQGSIDEAKEKSEAGEEFSPLNTEATSNERQQINQRLNQTLRTGNTSSELEQVSGTVTFPSTITPDQSSVLQLRTGLHSRSVDFQDQSVSTNQGQPFFSETRLSQDDFNLNFIGVPIDGSSEELTDNIGGQVGLITPEGEQFVEQIAPEAPVPTKGFAAAFDRLELARIDTRDINFSQFVGRLSLPSVELLWSGSDQNFNYGLSAGAWFNVDADSAPGVEENTLGVEEPSAGAYLSGNLNWIIRDLRQNDQGQTIGLDAHVPSFRVSWNSATNERNPFTAIASYTYLNQRQNRSFRVSPLIAYIPNGQEEEETETDLIGILSGGVDFNTGLSIDGSLEARDELFYTLETTQDVSSEIALGGFIRNFRRTLTGLPGRDSVFMFGPVMKVDLNNQDVALEARLGFGNSSPEFRIEGNANF
ncbi:hypothetical protein FRE64_08050 [Euhalothece natronophila Z-M001]|uniref:Uncharacterized protein n=1 Tax=Euhalothece natronophila Z-M001 TaxID=522448 RepID=A0A5B8NLL8_9CHRO|nr:hypothetical protein [Euhalothece natronophila]QDZ39898.1 hypothetical protein FRE64_08050 [Euhalothece natronophila Z-M001]